ncbi:glycosyltransferase [Pleomorphomonas oryzae]|uniref:glycosyltransferase n=1 Tax=Pleomorphomonas oryzae TaxID=261934 RepID=UPI0004267CA7|nr:glycosyltransferase [Pleomorphomonas oryzae]
MDKKISNKTSYKNVLIVALDKYPPFRVDIIELYRRSKENGFHITWIMTEDSERKGEIQDEIGDFIVISAKGNFIVRYIRSMLIHINAIMLIFGGKYQLVQCRDTFLISPLYRAVSKIKGVPFIYWMSYPMELGYIYRAKYHFKNGDIPGAIIRFTIGYAGRIAMKYLTLRYSSHLFVQSDQMRMDVIEDGALNSKITVVPMGVASSRYIKEPIDYSIGGIRADEFVILYTGAIDAARQMHIPAKGIARFLVGFDKAIFVIIGSSTKKERDLIKSVFEEYRVEKRVVFKAHMELRELLKWVQRADVCIASYPNDSPMLRSATPTKLVEYIAMGSRVVANVHPDQSYVIEKTRGGILVDFTPDGFYEGLLSAHGTGRLTLEEQEFNASWIKFERDYENLSDIVYKKYDDLLVKKI